MFEVGQTIYIEDRLALITGLTSSRIEYRFWDDVANTTYSCPLSEFEVVEDAQS